MKLNEYFNYIKSRLAFIPADFDRDYLNDYRANFAKYDFLMSSKFGGLPLMSDDTSEVRNMILASCFMHDYQWKTQYNTTVLEYNPIWNVDGTETKTSVYGNAVENSAKGATTKTDTMGSRTSSSNDDIYVNPFDSDTESHTGRTTNSNTLNSYVDTHSTDAVTDTLTKQEHTDTETLVRGGNIGVTSTQNLLNQEREVAYFNFVQIVMSDIINDIAVPVWSDFESDNAAGSDSTDYNLLVNKPSINNVELTGNKTSAELGLFSGSYNDLTDKPTLFSGSYNDLTDKPELFSGSYNDLTDKPVIPSDAAEISYNNDFSTLDADNVESALDELDMKSENLKDSQNVHFSSDVTHELETVKGGVRLQKIEGATVKDDSGLHVAGDMGLVDLSTLNWTLNASWNGANAYYTTDLSGKYKKVDNNVMPNMYCDKHTVMTRDALYNGKTLKGICTDNTGTYITVRCDGTPSGYLAYEVAEGATADKYCEVIKEHGKNLIDGFEKVGVFIDADGNIQSTTVQSGYTRLIKVKPNTTYSLTYHKSYSTNDRIHEYDKNGNWLRQNSIASPNTETDRDVSYSFTTGDCEFIRLSIGYNFKDIQFEEGEATAYAPYESKNVFVPLQGIKQSDGSFTPSPLCDGDRIDENGEYHKYGYIDLGNLTGWQSATVNGKTIIFTSLPNATAIREVASDIVCSDYNTMSYDDLVLASSDMAIATVNTNASVVISDSRHTSIPTTSDNWVKGIKLVYALATPSLTPLTSEQKIALNSLESYEGQTTITTVDNIATLSIAYGKSDTVATVLLADNQSKINEVKIADVESAEYGKVVKNGNGYRLYQKGNAYLLNLSGFTDTVANLNSALSDYIPTTEFRSVLADGTSKKAVILTVGTSGFQVIDIASWSYVSSYALNGQLQWIK